MTIVINILHFKSNAYNKTNVSTPIASIEQNVSVNIYHTRIISLSF